MFSFLIERGHPTTEIRMGLPLFLRQVLRDLLNVWGCLEMGGSWAVGGNLWAVERVKTPTAHRGMIGRYGYIAKLIECVKKREGGIPQWGTPVSAAARWSDLEIAVPTAGT